MSEVNAGPDTSSEPHSVDLYVGARIRRRRRELGLSQQALAAAIGLTFQQVQKYEKGLNRVSASRLFEMGRALGTPVAWFFDGLSPDQGDGPAEPDELAQLAATSEGLEMARLYPKLSGKERKSVLGLLRAMQPGEEG